MMTNDAILRGKICPYCEGDTEYIDSEYVYGRSYGMIYICKQCDAYVGVHKGTNKAKGRLANKTLRELKKRAHEYFDSLWLNSKDRRGARVKAYDWLAQAMGIERDLCHIGMFDEYQCKEAIDLIIKANKDEQKAECVKTE